MSRERINVIEKINELFQMTNVNDVIIKYGHIDYSQRYDGANKDGVFVEDFEDINNDMDKREIVLVNYDNQHDMFGIIQSIEGDSTSAIIYDIVKAVRNL